MIKMQRLKTVTTNNVKLNIVEISHQKTKATH